MDCGNSSEDERSTQNPRRDLLLGLHGELLRLAGLIAEALDSKGTGPGPEPWVDLRTAAAHASCSVDSIREMIADGRLPHGTLGKRAMRVRLSELDRALLGNAGVVDAGSVLTERAAEILRGLERGSSSRG